MKRGEIYYADLNPVVGSEIAKRRPVLIVSNNANNRAASTVTVVPLTSQVSRVYPFEVLLAMDDTRYSKSERFQNSAFWAARLAVWAWALCKT
jgi:mRNA interferase MazF